MKFRPNIRINKEYIVKIGIEMVSVVFAVLLALSVNEWRKNVSDRKLVTTACSNIKAEIKNNRDRLAILIPVHDSLLQIMDSLIHRIENNDMDIYFQISSINLELLSSTSWEAAKTTNAIHHMSFADVVEISSVYDAQQVYARLVDNFINYTNFETIGQTQPDDFTMLYIFQSYLQRFTGIGNQLLTLYDSLLDYLNFSGNKPAS